MSILTGEVNPYYAFYQLGKFARYCNASNPTLGIHAIIPL